MNRKEFVKTLGKKYGITQLDARDICDAVFDTLREVLEEGKNVYIFGFGTFKHKKRKGRMVYQPCTRNEIYIPDKDTIVFTKSTTDLSGEEDDSGDSDGSETLREIIENEEMEEEIEEIEED